MRKLLSIFLLASLIAPFLGSYLWVQVKRSQIRKEVKWKMIAGLDKEELVFMTFSIKDSQEKLNWKHSKEFEYKGEWYDVVQQEIVGDSIHYHLWWDHEETKLNKQLNEIIVMTVNQDSQTKENQGRVAKLFKSLFFQTKEKRNKIIFGSELVFKYVFIEKVYTSIIQAIDVPPPELMS